MLHMERCSRNTLIIITISIIIITITIIIFEPPLLRIAPRCLN